MDQGINFYFYLQFKEKQAIVSQLLLDEPKYSIFSCNSICHMSVHYSWPGQATKRDHAIKSWPGHQRPCFTL